MIRPLLMAASLLTLALVAVSPADACTALDQRCTYPDPSSGPIQAGGPVDCATFNPGTPGGGTLGFAEWFAKADASTACNAAGSVQNVALQQGGNVAWTIGTAANGALGLANAAGLAPALTAYESNLAVAAVSQVHDACFVALGSTCGSDPTVTRAQSCPGGASLPELFPGSLTGYTLDNANSALQGTCTFEAAAALSAPTQGQVTAYAGAEQAAVGGQATATLGAAAGLSGPAFATGSQLLDNACIWLTGATPCT